MCLKYRALKQLTCIIQNQLSDMQQCADKQSHETSVQSYSAYTTVYLLLHADVDGASVCPFREMGMSVYFASGLFSNSCQKAVTLPTLGCRNYSLACTACTFLHLEVPP